MLDVIFMSGIVGFLLCNIEIWLEFVLELGYDVLDKKRLWGEICICGKMVFLGYYKCLEFMEEVFVDGWFYIGMFCII